MKTILYLFTALLIITSSCTKVIDVDLNEANPNIVIEANFTAEDSIVRVHLSLTSNYFDASSSTTVNSATVTITDELGSAQTLSSTGNGDYILANYIPSYNTTYTMDVSLDGVTYTASSLLPSPVQLQDITFEYVPGFFNFSAGYISFLNFDDPADTTNYYFAVITKNGIEHNELTDIILNDDRLTDGNSVSRPLFVDSLFDLGDVVGIELRSVDEDVFFYYSEAISIAGGQQSAAPANPTSNWNNKALGYFSAYSNTRKNAIVL